MNVVRGEAVGEYGLRSFAVIKDDKRDAEKNKRIE